MKISSVFVEKVLFRMNNIIGIPMKTCNNYIEEHIKKKSQKKSVEIFEEKRTTVNNFGLENLDSSFRGRVASTKFYVNIL